MMERRRPVGLGRLRLPPGDERTGGGLIAGLDGLHERKPPAGPEAGGNKERKRERAQSSHG